MDKTEALKQRLRARKALHEKLDGPGLKVIWFKAAKENFDLAEMRAANEARKLCPDVHALLLKATEKLPRTDFEQTVQRTWKFNCKNAPENHPQAQIVQRLLEAVVAAANQELSLPIVLDGEISQFPELIKDS